MGLRRISKSGMLLFNACAIGQKISHFVKHQSEIWIVLTAWILLFT